MFLYTFYKKVCRFSDDVLIRQIPLCRSPKGAGCLYKIAQKIGKEPMMCQFLDSPLVGCRVGLQRLYWRSPEHNTPWEPVHASVTNSPTILWLVSTATGMVT